MLTDVRNSLIVLGIVVILTILIHVLRAARPHRLSMEQRNLIATNFGFFATLYTFFLGFAVVSLWQSYNNADSFITNETEMLMAEYRLSQSLPESEGFRKALQDYVGWVKTDGWQAMRDGKINDGSDKFFDAIWKEAQAMKPKDPADRTYYTLVAGKVVELNALRKGRLFLVEGNLYTPIWVVIYLGVLFTIGSFYFLDSGSKSADLFFIIMMVTMVMANLFLIYELNTPFSGYISLGPEKFEALHARMLAIGAGG